MDMSIEDSIKDMVEASVKTHTLPIVDKLRQKNSVLEHKLNWAEKKLNETMELLRNRNMQIEDRELSGNKIDGGLITNFESTGVKDSATNKVVDVKDDGVLVHKDLEVKGKIFAATLQYHSANVDNLDVKTSVRIGANEVLWKDRLGNSVKHSQLRQVGTLDNLNVNDTLRVEGNKVGVGMSYPAGKFGVNENEIEVGIGTKGDTGFVGTVNSDPFAIGSGHEPTLFVSHDNKIGIKIKKPKADLDVAGYIRYQGQTQQYLDRTPTSGNWSQGDIVWNSSPQRGSVLGWVCVKPGAPGTWRPFVSID
jgi:hypothetical protein